MDKKKNFLMACFLGILHHQRPGFLSYPSSHLVPYLRDKRYPKMRYPELYEYRELHSRLISKIKRSYRIVPKRSLGTDWTFRKSSIRNLTFPNKFDCIITSPPYMNTLDYIRDNRLRLWFINPTEFKNNNDAATRNLTVLSFVRSCGYGQCIHRALSVL